MAPASTALARLGGEITCDYAVCVDPADSKAPVVLSASVSEGATTGGATLILTVAKPSIPNSTL